MRFFSFTPLLFLAVLSCFIQTLFADKDAPNLEVGKVIKLEDPAHFDALKKTDQIILFKFYADWCGHCKRLAPVLDKVAIKLKENNVPVKIVKIDCEQHTALAAQEGVQGYPTLKILRNGVVHDFNGDRSEEGLYKYLEQQTQPDWSHLFDHNITDFKSKGNVVVVAHFKDPSSSEAKAFHSLASTHREKHQFGIVNDPKLLDVSDAEDNEFIIHRKVDGAKIRHKGGFNVKELEAFLHKEAVPLVGEIDEHSFEHYASAKKPLLFLFYSDESQVKDLRPTLESLAQKYRDRFNFGVCDAKRFGSYAEELTLKSEWPAIAIQNIETREKWALPQTKPITPERVSAFVDEVASGKLSSSIKSQVLENPINGNVYQVTANTFDDIVINSKKDVLVEFFAPWCQHCKRLEPTIQKLAGLVNGDHVQIVQFDGSQNDFPKSVNADITGFPTLKLYTANNKQKPIDFNGDRTEDGILNFLKANVHHKDAMEKVVLAPEPEDERSEL